jgi:hypothetical protein
MDRTVPDCPQVSVILAVYNGETYLAESVESILGQQGVELELLVVDDGSTDKTSEILAAVTDPRLTVLQNATNLGLTASLNRGLLLAKAPLVARQDADDVSLPQRLARQVRLLNQEGADICFCRSEMQDPARGRYWTWCELEEPLRSWRSLFTNFYGPHPTALFRREAVMSLGGYDESFLRGQDYDLWDRCKAAGMKFVYLREVLLRYRIHKDAISNQYKHEQLEAGRRISERALRRIFPDICQTETDGLRWLLFEPLDARPTANSIGLALRHLIGRVSVYVSSVPPPAHAIWIDVVSQLAHRIGRLKGPLWRQCLISLLAAAWRGRSLALYSQGMRFLTRARG